MKRKMVLFLSALLLCSCGQQPTEEPTEAPTVEKIPTYQIKVVDIDGEILGEKDIAYNENVSVFDDLINNFDVDYTTGDYGAYISRINGSIIDNNYYLAVYENKELASTGVEGLVANEHDVFEFRVDCWNTIESGYGVLDNYDVLVDKVIYGYMKQLDLSKSTSFTDGSFWDLMTINVGMNNYYDSSLFNFNSISEAVKNELETYDVTTLENANLFKYYLYSKALNKDLAAVKTYAESYINTLSDDYNDYVSPFIVAACYGLGIENEKVNTLVNKEVSTNFVWGPDIPVWQYCTSRLYNQEISNSTLQLCVEKLDYENSCSNALVLQAFAAANVNIRDSKYDINGKDLIEVLFDNYYNQEKNILEYTKGVENTYSANQTIVSLMAYKACRDNQKAVNIYG